LNAKKKNGAGEKRSMLRLTVEEFLELFEDMQFFLFVAIEDEKTCPVCTRYAKGLMTRREIKQTFDYLDMLTDDLWIPNVHPNCRCMLLLWERQPAGISRNLNI